MPEVVRCPKSILVVRPNENLHTHRGLGLPGEPLMGGWSIAKEQCVVARLGRILPSGGPKPMELVRGSWVADAVKPTPKLNVLDHRYGTEHALDVLNPGVEVQTLLDHTVLPTVMWN